MRAVIFVMAMLALGSPAIAESPAVADECVTPAQITARIESKFGAENSAIYKGQESFAIKGGIERRSGLTLDGDREFLLFTLEGSDRILIVGFKGGCYEAQIFVSRHDLDDWLAGQEAQKP